MEPQIGCTYPDEKRRCRKNHAPVRYNGTEKIAFFVGDYVPTLDVRYSCQSDGFYAPECGIRPHENDIVELISQPPHL